MFRDIPTFRGNAHVRSPSFQEVLAKFKTQVSARRTEEPVPRKRLYSNVENSEAVAAPKRSRTAPPLLPDLALPNLALPQTSLERVTPAPRPTLGPEPAPAQRVTLPSLRSLGVLAISPTLAAFDHGGYGLLDSFKNVPPQTGTRLPSIHELSFGTRLPLPMPRGNYTYCEGDQRTHLELAQLLIQLSQPPRPFEPYKKPGSPQRTRFIPITPPSVKNKLRLDLMRLPRPTPAVRVCILCGSDSLPCWRPSWSTKEGQLCNSCGLRYKKTAARCLNAECKKIPAKGEWAVMQAKGKKQFPTGEAYCCLDCGDQVEVK